MSNSTPLHFNCDDSAWATRLPRRVSICGAGHISHFLLCSLTQNPGIFVKVFAPYKDHGERLRAIWQNRGSVDEGLRMSGALGECSADLDRISVVSDPREAFSDTDLVIFAMPAPAYLNYLLAVCRHASNNTVLMGLPGVGCFEWACSSACEQVGRPLSDFKIVFTQESPLSCRIEEFGRRVFLRGIKQQGILVGCLPADGEHTFCAWIEKLLFGQISVRAGSALQVAIGTSIMIAHGFTLQACWQELDDDKRSLRPGELLWYGSEARNKLMDDADKEWRQVADALLSPARRSDQRPPATDLVSFFQMWRCWYPEVWSCESLAAVVAENSAYQWTTVPSTAVTSSSGDVETVPNTADRKFSGDIPFGLCLVKLLAAYVEVETPVFDQCIAYLQEKMGKDYIRFEPGTESGKQYGGSEGGQAALGVLCGEDLKKDGHFVPLLSGRCGLKEYLDFYSPSKKDTAGVGEGASAAMTKFKFLGA